MILVREIGTAVRMVMVTLWLQSVGLAALILWIRHTVAGNLSFSGRMDAMTIMHEPYAE